MATSLLRKSAFFFPHASPSILPVESAPYHEYKYLIHPDQLVLCKRMLDSFYPNSDPYPTGALETTYFDTLALDCFEQCMGGEAWKCKFRVRQYPDTQLAQAQVKVKSLSQVAKWKARLAPETITSSPWHTLVTAKPEDHLPLRALAARFGCLVPVMQVDYRRLRYRSMDSRINLDEQIRFERRSSVLGRSYTRQALSFAVLEIKTTSVRPFLPFLGVVQARPASFSKYGVGLDMLVNGPGAIVKYL